jgi:hypothetical protein
MSFIDSAFTDADIDTIYTDVLQRPATPQEQSAWVSLEGSLTQGQILLDITNSPEAQALVWPVVRLYQAAFDRVPDQAGFTVNVDALHNGTTLLQLTADFVSSPEFTALYGATNPNVAATQPLIHQLYENVLGRAETPAEDVAWLATGETAAQVVYGFANSVEFQEKVNPVIPTGVLYYDSHMDAMFPNGFYTGHLPVTT